MIAGRRRDGLRPIGRRAFAQNQEVTIAGFTGSAANYNGTFVITSVNTSNNTFTYTDPTRTRVCPPILSGGTALVNPENGITNLYVMQPSTLGGNTPSPWGRCSPPRRSAWPLSTRSCA